MGAIAKYGTTLVVLINTLFGLIGLLLLIGGCLVKFAADKVDALLTPLLGVAEADIPEYLDIDIKDFKPSEFFGETAIVFIIIGCILVCVVVWAYCGTCCQSRWMLVVYVCLLTLIVIGEIAVSVILTKQRSLIDNAVKGPLKASIQKYYQGSEGHNAISLSWNVLMKKMDCCGVDGAMDFNNTESWDHQLNTTYLKAPAVCCKNETTMPTCGNPIPEYNMGCYAALWKLIEDHQAVVIGVAAGILVLQVVLWIVSVCIIKDMSQKNRVYPAKS